MQVARMLNSWKMQRCTLSLLEETQICFYFFDYIPLNHKNISVVWVKLDWIETRCSSEI